MHGKIPAPRGTDFLNQGWESFTGVLLIHTDTTFDRNRHMDGILHRCHTFGDKVRLQHQAGAEPPGLHPV